MMQDSPKLAAAAAQAHGREELYPSMGASRLAAHIAPMAARPLVIAKDVLASYRPRISPCAVHAARTLRSAPTARGGAQPRYLRSSHAYRRRASRYGKLEQSAECETRVCLRRVDDL